MTDAEQNDRGREPLASRGRRGDSVRAEVQRRRDGPLDNVTDPTGAAALPDAVGPYEVLGHIATGGMGVIYRVRHPESGVELALKILKGRPDAEMKERFIREAEAEARLDHPNIVRVFDIGEEDGQHYFTMELIDGEPFDRVLERRESLKDIVELLAQIALGLDHAHDNGLIHRDMKPQNVMVSRDGIAKLTDFGLARDLGLTSLSRSGDIIGTPLYMAPEQMDTKLGKVDRRTDVFALGVMLYQALTTRLPFPARSLPDLQRMLLGQDPPPPGKLHEGVPPELEKVCLKALQKNPGRRHQSAGEFASELHAWLNVDTEDSLIKGSITETGDVSLIENFSDSLRGPLVAVSVAAGGLLLALVLGAMVLIGGGGEENTPAARKAAFEKDRHRFAGELLELARRLDEARTEASARSVTADESLRQVRRRLAELRRRILDHPLGRADFESQLAEIEFRSATELARLLRRLSREGPPAEALAVVKEAMEHLPLPSCPADLRLLRGELELALGESEAALHSFDSLLRDADLTEDRQAPTGEARATPTADELKRALFGRGRAHLALGSPDFAVSDLRAVLSGLGDRAPAGLSPPAVRLALAEAELDAGDYSSAERRLVDLVNSPLKDSVEFREAARRLVRLRIDKGDVNGAKRVVDRVGSPDSDRIMAMSLARLLLTRDDLRAEKLMEQALLEPDVVGTEGFLLAAEVRLHSGELEDALVSCKRGLERDPNHAALLMRRAEIYYLAAMKDEAFADMRRLEQLSGVGPLLRHRARLLRLHLDRATGKDFLEHVKSWLSGPEGRKAGTRQSFEVERLEHLLSRGGVKAEDCTRLVGELSDPWRSSRRMSRLIGRLLSASGNRKAAIAALRSALLRMPADAVTAGLLRQLGVDPATVIVKRQGERLPPPKLGDVTLDAWDPVLEAAWFLSQARVIESQDPERANRMRRWASGLLGPDEIGMLRRQD